MHNRLASYFPKEQTIKAETETVPTAISKDLARLFCLSAQENFLSTTKVYQSKLKDVGLPEAKFQKGLRCIPVMVEVLRKSGSRDYINVFQDEIEAKLPDLAGRAHTKYPEDSVIAVSISTFAVYATNGMLEGLSEEEIFALKNGGLAESSIRKEGLVTCLTTTDGVSYLTVAKMDREETDPIDFNKVSPTFKVTKLDGPMDYISALFWKGYKTAQSSSL